MSHRQTTVGGAGIDAMTFRVRRLRDVLLNVSVTVNCQRDTTQWNSQYHIRTTTRSTLEGTTVIENTRRLPLLHLGLNSIAQAR